MKKIIKHILKNDGTEYNYLINNIGATVTLLHKNKNLYEYPPNGNLASCLETYKTNPGLLGTIGVLFGNTSGALRVASATLEGQVLQASAVGTPEFAMLDGGAF